MKTFICTVALLVGLLTNANAQSLRQSADLSSFLQVEGMQVSKIQQNLLGMMGGMSPDSREFAALSHLTESVNLTDAALTTVGTLTYIHSAMLAKQDQTIVQKYLKIHTKSALFSTGATIKSANRSLVLVQSSAALAEVQKLRDLMQKVSDEISRIVP